MFVGIVELRDLSVRLESDMEAEEQVTEELSRDVDEMRVEIGRLTRKYTEDSSVS